MPATIVNRERRFDLKPVLVVSGRDLRGERFTERTHAVDISGGGLCFQCAHNLSLGMELLFQVYIPHALRRHFRKGPIYWVRGVVSRVERMPGQESYRVGARFTGEAEPGH
jgi:hypothetical protein